MNTDAPRPERATLTDEERLHLRRIHRDAMTVDAATVDWVLDGIETWVLARDAAREQALREEIAGEIERKSEQLNAAEDYGRGGRDGLKAAARIARGGTR